MLKIDKKIIAEMERLLSHYTAEVNEALENGYLTKNTAGTYLVHADHFVNWCKGEFEPGAKNKIN